VSRADQLTASGVRSVIGKRWGKMLNVLVYFCPKNIKAFTEVYWMYTLLVCWSGHVDNMVKEVTQRLYLLKQLKSAGLPGDHLFRYYSTVVWPVLKHCVPVWHYISSKAQIEQLQSVQKRTVYVILNLSRRMPYHWCLQCFDAVGWAAGRASGL